MIFQLNFQINVIILIINLIFNVIQCFHLKKQDANAFYPEKCHLIPKQNEILFANFPEGDSNSRTKRDTDSNRHFIIHPHYHKSFDELRLDIHALYKEELIPEAISYWENSLQVKYEYNPLLLGRACPSAQVYFERTSKTMSCDNNCSTVTKCGEYIIVPEEHLDVCRYCTSSGICRETGPKKAGVAADFILYISAISTEHCSNSNTIAFASYCQLETRYNRPVAGYVNICPHATSVKKSDIHSALATLKHEILHALGFSAGLYAFFLDENGIPLTPRDSKSGKPPYNPSTSMYEPSDKVVKIIKRPNWKTNDGFIERTVSLIVTPNVVREVRRHFNCSTLEGAELEDQGDIGTKHTHWEKRVFENEAMTGTYTQSSVFSRITFAFLEDTGWYRVNYSYAEELSWGKNLGCEFVKESCKSWIEKQSSKRLPIHPFCNNLPTIPETTSKYECNANRDAVLLCNLMKYNETIPKQYRNFNTTLSLSKFSNLFRNPNYDLLSKHIGGSVVLADYCPFMQQVSWSINNDNVRDSKCTFEENKPDPARNYVLEDYGRDSKCILHNHTWHIHTDRCQYRKTVSKTVGCYNYFCDTNQGLVIKIYDNKIICSYKGQVVEFIITHDEKVYFGNVVCPSCEELCKDQINCPANDYQYKPQQSTLTIRFINPYSNKYTTPHNENEYCQKEISMISSSTVLIASKLFIFNYYLINLICFFIF